MPQFDDALSTSTDTNLKTGICCYISLGSNLGDSIGYLKKAVSALRIHPAIHKIKTSRLYRSKPHGPQNQPDYYNAAVSFETSVDSESLLDIIQSIENDNNRMREGVLRWGARTLDIDLLFYGDEVISTDRLKVPHPHICERAFVLLPLMDLEKNLKFPDSTTIKECIDQLPDSELQNTQPLYTGNLND